jgi:ubiquinone/menaquinone biosynthesis C-methylase UbiE
MKKTDYHTSKFQQNFYDRLSETRVADGGLFSCGFEERYNPRLVFENEQAFKVFHDLYSPLFADGTQRVILDMCSGSGIHLPVLSQFPGTVVGVDLSIGLLNKAYELKRELKLDNAFLVQSLAETVAFRDDSFDAVVMVDGIHHVEDQDKMMRELQRVARANAPFMLIEPNISNPLVYLAHRIPKEERGALRVNTARGLTTLLSPYVADITIKPFNQVASKKSTPLARAAFRMIEWACAKVFFFWPIRILVQGRFHK